MPKQKRKRSTRRSRKRSPSDGLLRQYLMYKMLAESNPTLVYGMPKSVIDAARSPPPPPEERSGLRRAVEAVGEALGITTSPPQPTPPPQASGRPQVVPPLPVPISPRLEELFQPQTPATDPGMTPRTPTPRTPLVLPSRTETRILLQSSPPSTPTPGTHLQEPPEIQARKTAIILELTDIAEEMEKLQKGRTQGITMGQITLERALQPGKPVEHMEKLLNVAKGVLNELREQIAKERKRRKP